MQLEEVSRLDNKSFESRFYYSGFAQAVLLDRISPDWKKQLWQEDANLEDFLKQAANLGNEIEP